MSSTAGDLSPDEQIGLDVPNLREIVDSVSSVVYESETGPHGRFLYVSAKIEELLGYTPDEWLANPDLWLSLVHAEDRESTISIEGRQVANGPGDSGVIEYRMQRRDGTVVWIRDDARLSRRGNSYVWRGTLTDVTRERRGRQILASAVERYREMIASLPDCPYRATAKEGGRWLVVSPQIEELLGYTAEEWLATPGLWEESLHPEDRERILGEERRLAGLPDVGATVVSYRLRNRAGDYVEVRDRAHRRPGPAGVPVRDGVLSLVNTKRREPDGDDSPDAFRLTCLDCEATWVSKGVQACPECRSGFVDALSLNATLRELTRAKARVKELLGGIEHHLETLAASRRAGERWRSEV